jgi:hypothetical protein
MPLRWKLFRLVCVLQILLVVGIGGYSFIMIFLSGSHFYYFLNAIAFVMMMLLANLGLGVLTNNYPDEPIVDAQKSRFNWLFLLNFLLISFSSAHIVAEYRFLNEISVFSESITRLPIKLLGQLILYLFIFIFHLIILYGLFFLRREIYANYLQKKFEFEKT